ncbi:MAG: SlyX protein [Gammaproteobacteria bacterium]|nr:SlyX protein [Gammaproteobacteria bacterium]|tara:strand:- start:2736 stop:2942 length:207 start_codon:yes stop_codon:yes gene_type:complete
MNDNRFIHLETKLAYQDQMMHELNEIVIEQQKKMIKLEKLYKELVCEFQSFERTLLSNPIHDDKPPHY